MSAVDVNTGSYLLFDETTDDPVKAVLSSASIPFVFPNQKWGGHVAMDGGTVFNLNMVSAVHRCREIVDDDSMINIDILMCSAGKEAQEGWEYKNKAVSNFLRYQDIKSAYESNDDVREFMKAFPKVNFRYYVEPTEPIPGGLDIINVDNTTITWPLQELGRKDGGASVLMGPGESFKKKFGGTEDLEFI